MARRILVFPFAFILCLIVSPKTAADGSDCDLGRKEEPKLALTGLDPVLLVSGREEAGKKAIHLRHGDFTYWFSSDATRRVFRDNPDRYKVQTQGFCPFRPDLPGKSDIYLVHEGRIYLFFSQSCRTASHGGAGSFVPL